MGIGELESLLKHDRGESMKPLGISDPNSIGKSGTDAQAQLEAVIDTVLPQDHGLFLPADVFAPTTHFLHFSLMKRWAGYYLEICTGMSLPH